MKSIKSIKNLKSKYVLVRLDLNVPIKNGRITSTFKIEQSLDTIKFLQKGGARIILISHLGRDKNSLLPVSRHLAKHIKIDFIKDKIGSSELFKKISEMKDGSVVLLENIRQYDGEENGDKKFAKELAGLADIYVNDAFGVSHREHASLTGVPKLLPSYAGLRLEDEVKNLSLALSPAHPFFVIFGGAKPETKLPLTARFLKIADHVFIGGVLANIFLKAKGYEIGKSVHDEDAKIPKNVLNNKKIVLPCSVVIENKKEVSVRDIKKTEKILDIGFKSLDEISLYIKSAKLILWNGPMGWYEFGQKAGTDKLIKMLLQSKSKIIIGGGDTAFFFEHKKIPKNVFVSTGGGATLEFLSKGTLPGIKALK